MKKLFLYVVLCALGLTSLYAQTENALDPVRWVYAEENETSVNVTWGMGFSETVFEGFETGDFTTRDWKHDAEHPWVITEESCNGSFAMKSTCEKVDDGVSAIELEVNVPENGFLSFNHRVSSETKCDFGNFYIDGVLQTSIAGNHDWRYVEVYVEAGTHTYKWEYAKDYLTNMFDDAYFVDDITFHKEIEVKEGWIGYDDNVWATSVGTGNPNPTYFGISFPTTVQYAGLTLSKIAVFDAKSGGEAEYTANIYLGGDTVPETLVSTQKFNLNGADAMKEVELTTPVTLDGTQPLWITLYCDKLAYPVPLCAQSEYLTTDWLSLDGTTWVHAQESGLYGTIMLRGYVEDANGRMRALASNTTVPTFEGGMSTGKFMLKEATETVNIGSTMVKSAERGFSEKYNVYKKDLYKNTTELVAENTTATEYVDNTWQTAEVGSYKWGVAAVYDEGESEIVWTKAIDKDMATKVTVTVNMNNEDPITGTAITLKNTVESEYVYSTVLALDNTFVFEDFHKGVYEVSITKKGYSSEYDNKTVEIWDATTIECELVEELYPVTELYVSPTGYAMWEGAAIGAGDEFYYDFEEGNIDGWVTIDADGDNYNWMNSIEILSPGSGHNSSLACVTSMSYIYQLVLHPDNYLVTEKKYKIDETSKFKFYVCAQDESFAAEHYGVAISLGSNTDAADFVTIWEETLTAKSGSSKATRGTRQGNWYEKVIDLSQYAGQEIHIALRHFNCTDQFYINVDDISLETENRSSRALQSYKVYLNDELVSENVTNANYEFENLTDGNTYKTTIIPVYSSGDGPATSYTWTKVACDEFEGVSDLVAKYNNGETSVEWTLPEAEAKSRASRAGEWLKYDNGTYVEKIGLTYDGNGEVFEQFKWGVMFPAADVAKYTGHNITKIALYDCEAYTGEVSIYEGGSTAPETLLHSQSYTCTGVNDMVEVALTKSVKVSGNKNIWVVLFSGDGKQPAAHCGDQGKPNGRWLYYNEYYGWIDNMLVTVPPATWMIRAYVTDDENEVVDNSSAEKLGVMLYRNGELVSKKLIEGESYVVKNTSAADEYTVRLVYGGEKDVTYYAISCPQTVTSVLSCPSPRDLKAYSTIQDGKIGTMLMYPYVPPTSKWMNYDNGQFMTGIGGVEEFSWGIMFTAEQLENYAGTDITKIAFFDATYPEPKKHTGTINIYYGGENAPELLVHSQPYEGEGMTQGFTEVELSYPLPVSGDESIWIIMKTVDGDLYPAAMSQDCGDKNSRWISMDGVNWEDAIDYGLDGTFMIRAFLTNERGESKALNPSSRELTLKNYNIYRGTSLDNVEVVAETTNRSYFDEVEKGTYYYQVTAVYEEDGMECESEPAKSYDNDSQDYVVVEVTAIEENGVSGVMIYPNPTKGNLNVNVEAMKRITIVNTLGQIVYDQEVASDNEIIDMSQYETGIYMVRIVTENGVAVKRVSVVR